VNTRRRTAWPHPPSRPPQPGHQSRPSPRSDSTPAALLPTVSNGASKHPHGPPRASRKGNGEGRPKSDVLTVSSHATPPQPEPPRKRRSPSPTQPPRRRSPRTAA